MTTYRVLSDLLYRSVATVTTSNVIEEAFDTDAYGNTLCYSGPGTDGIWFSNDDVKTNSPSNATIYTGRQYDPESQLYYYRARYLNPTIGRFISRDLLLNSEFWQGPNLYAYVNDTPTATLDPSGLFDNSLTTPEGAAALEELNGDAAAARAAAARAAAAAAAKKAAQQQAAKAAAIAAAASAAQAQAHQALCLQIWSQYKALNNCSSCLPCDDDIEIAIKLTCLYQLRDLRQQYLDNNCDYVLPGSINRGSKKAEEGHQTEVDKTDKRIQDCLDLAY